MRFTESNLPLSSGDLLLLLLHSSNNPICHAGGVDPWHSCLKGGVSEAQIVKPGVGR